MTSSQRPSRVRALFRTHPRLTTITVAVLVLLVGANIVLALRWMRYREETARLRAEMTDAERRRADLVVASEQNRVRVMLELVKRQAQLDAELHLSVAVDSGRMMLEQDGVALRDMRVTVGPARVVGTPPDTVRLVPPRGERTVVRVLSAGDAWEVPHWVYADRGVPTPADRTVKGALGRSAIVLTGGTVLYATPSQGPLADSTYVMPGSILVPSEDLRAIAPNIFPGMSVYFYE